MTNYNDTLPIRIMIVDDHTILAESMARLLNEQSDFEVVNKSYSAKEAIAFLDKNPQTIDIVILDLQMEDTKSNEHAGFKVARHIMENIFKKEVEEVRILIMSQFEERYLIEMAHKIGVHGYLHKDCESNELFDAIRWIVKNKRRYYRGKIAEAWDDFSEEMSGNRETPYLTATEKEVLQMIAEGMTTTEIAIKRNRGEDGVEAHRRNLMRKLNANNAPHLIALAYKWGFIR